MVGSVFDEVKALLLRITEEVFKEVATALSLQLKDSTDIFK
jgi:hypothetical protein